MIVYLDTSSLVKLYVEETDSGKIRAIASNATVISTSKAAYAEARAAFARKQKEGGFSSNALRKIVGDLNRDLESYFVIEITGVVMLGFLKYGSKFVNFRGGVLGFIIGIIELYVCFECSDFWISMVDE